MIAVCLLLVAAGGGFPAQAAGTAVALNVATPADNSTVYNPVLTVAGQAINAATLAVQGVNVPLAGDGSFSTGVNLSPGLNTITVTAAGATGTATVTLRVTYDDTPRIFNLRPADGSYTSSPQISGEVANATEIRLVLPDGSVQAIAPNPDGSFLFSPALSFGPNTLTVIAFNAPRGLTISRVLTLYYWDGNPHLTRLSPAAGSSPVLYDRRLTVSGKVFNGPSLSGVSLSYRVTNSTGTVTGEGGIPFDKGGSFSRSLELSPGTNTLTLTVNGPGGSNLYTITPTYQDWPAVAINYPSGYPPWTASSYSVVLSGTLYHSDQATLRLNGVERTLRQGSGAFATTLDLEPGQNQVTVTATSARYPLSPATVQFFIGAPTGPSVILTSPGVNPYETTASLLTLAGRVTGGSGLTLDLFDEQGDLRIDRRGVSLAADGSFSTTVSLYPGLNTITLAASDGKLSTTVTLLATFQDYPFLQVDSPADGSSQDTPEVTVTGYVYHADAGGLAVNGRAVAFNSAGWFSHLFYLAPGENVITVTATRGNRRAGRQLRVTYTGSPAIRITSPAEGAVVHDSTITVKGMVLAPNPGQAVLQLNGVRTTVAADGTFSGQVPLKPGANAVSVNATVAGQQLTSTLKVTYDDGPSITVDEPGDGARIQAERVTVRGRVRRTGAGGLKVNNQAVSFDSEGDFTWAVPLKAGSNTITVVARNGSKSAKKTLRVTADYAPSVDISVPSDNQVVESNFVVVVGRAANTPRDGLQVGKETVTLDSEGHFRHQVALKPGLNTITFTAKNQLQTVKKSLRVTYTPSTSIGARERVEIAAAGTKAVAFGGLLQLEAPAGSLPAGKAVVVEVADPAYLSPPRMRALAGNVFSLNGPKPTGSFTLALKYPSGLPGAQLTRLAVARYQPSTGQWEAVGGKVDPQQGTVSAAVPELGNYAAVIYYGTFDDLLGHWAREEIEVLTAKGVVHGSGENTFAPEATVTRAQLAKILVRALGLAAEYPGFGSFEDVPNTYWAYGEVEAAARAGIIRGVSARRFDPDRPVTREDLATMVARSANLALPGTSQAEALLRRYQDSGAVASYAREALAGAVRAGLLAGDNLQRLEPKKRATRAEAATLAVRLMRYLGKI